MLVSLGEVFAGLGQREDALRLARRVIERMPTWATTLDPYQTSSFRYFLITQLLALAQDRDAVLAQLDAYLSDPGYFSIESFSRDPRLEFILDDPDFQALVKKHGRE